MNTQTETDLFSILDRLLKLVERDFADVREQLADLDHATVKRGPFEELHNRVDAIERMSR